MQFACKLKISAWNTSGKQDTSEMLKSPPDTSFPSISYIKMCRLRWNHHDIQWLTCWYNNENVAGSGVNVTGMQLDRGFIVLLLHLCSLAAV